LIICARAGPAELEVGAGQRIAAQSQEHFSQLHAKHPLVGMPADVVLEMHRRSGPVATFEALGGQRESVGFEGGCVRGLR
jgi:hypothetical protein